jgi:two-component system, chemotaxis family, protein-glutamate methylesterase/glutaminase
VYERGRSGGRREGRTTNEHLHESPQAAVALAASAGGVGALTEFVTELPADFGAAVLVVLHIAPSGTSVLPGILARAGRLAARHPHDGEPLAPGVVFVAPPDRHLAVRDGKAWLLATARENGHRPAADVLLRSTAQAYGSRAAGVVLSGTMDDGAAGLRAIQAGGGLTLVQDPATAAFPGMPKAAIQDASPDFVGSVPALAATLRRWVGAQASADTAPVPDPVADNGAGLGDMRELTPLTCPECGGTLWQRDEYGVERFRCRVGHAYSAHRLLGGKGAAVEAALWAAIVALDERAEVSDRMAKRLTGAGRPERRERYASIGSASRAQAEMLRDLVHSLVEAVAESEEAGDGSATS